MATGRSQNATMRMFAEVAVEALGTERVSHGLSRPARGVWIETGNIDAEGWGREVTPRAGRVD